MRKILIFTASTGGGHNQAAASLEELLKSNGYSVVKLDALKETNKLLDSFISDGYRILVKKFPKTYRELYKLSDRRKVNFKITRIITKFLRNKIYQIIQKHNPEVIIATHPFLVNVIGELKEEGKICIPFISVVTDYKIHQTYVHSSVDAYITGSYYTKLSMMERGIPKEKIYHYGIPIRKEFFVSSIDKKKNKKDDFTILLMCGSIGLKAMEKVLKRLVKSKNRIKIIAVCGNDVDLRIRIEQKYMDKYEDKEIIVYGFTNKIPELMDISDIIISKPGGLTVSESIAKNIPMVIPYVIPGQEEENADFLVHTGAGIRVKKIKEITDVIDNLIENPSLLREMKKNIKKLSKTYSMESIVEIVNKLIEENKYNTKNYKKERVIS
ncbi:processive 1,2-diacylglycerol beta-glucosyltransferase [Caminicella sporogenes DSM 14501]|uniref:Processive 1,2-diacylglycerol beta-glucosyltransferase n=1 Tax=Caminicella sporogenes DSM 14501 TaxID=1121266 RepID=A0A1M6N5D4_9FIRM|nr:glycosyltransferase [Caminicella sporogenes]RKD22355.1 hypothetical protein BET04_04795 [Caminicella sporogenes]SHJ90907.1 processive 1,2-diacylglycerol beta-glucosyltransferase [Caminicella sporogenes DSM 14501]